tara:strand:- start:4 stop:282 length:279 start_codon:yes stop_codon:yes gene_type:complete
MKRLFFSICLGFFLGNLVINDIAPAHAKEINIDDLLNPQPTTLQNDQNQLSKSLDQGANKKLTIDDLLGPKDNFPFLPDNHRDSGTGKYNAF